jgi:branched-chain amino acid transport system substrate-binding protein
LYAANQYDAIMLLDSAIRALGGKIEDQAALRAALRKADFKSLRGSFKFNVNNFPIQDYYIAEVTKRDDGEPEFTKLDLAMKDGKDSFYEECKMPTQ